MSDSVQPHRWPPTRLPRPWDSPGKDTAVGCHFLLQCMKVKSESVAQSCPSLLDPMDCSLPGSSVHGIFPGKSTEVGRHCLLQLNTRNIFITVGAWEVPDQGASCLSSWWRLFTSLADNYPPAISLHGDGKRREGNTVSFFIRELTHLGVPPSWPHLSLIISHRPRLLILIPLHRVLGLQHMNLGRWNKIYFVAYHQGGCDITFSSVQLVVSNTVTPWTEAC